MKRSCFFYSFLIIFFACCQSATNDRLNQFKIIDSPVQQSNTIDNVYSNLYEHIQENRSGNSLLASRADTLVNATKAARDFIEQLKEKIREKDTVGTRLDLGNQYILNNSNAVILTSKLTDVYIACTAPLSTKRKLNEADSLFAIFDEIKSNKNWAYVYFDNMPGVAVITTLNFFQNNCLNLATFSLKDIRAKLIE